MSCFKDKLTLCKAHELNGAIQQLDFSCFTQGAIDAFSH